jgi:hypothetical protein
MIKDQNLGNQINKCGKQAQQGREEGQENHNDKHNEKQEWDALDPLDKRAPAVCLGET